MQSPNISQSEDDASEFERHTSYIADEASDEIVEEVAPAKDSTGDSDVIQSELSPTKASENNVTKSVSETNKSYTSPSTKSVSTESQSASKSVSEALPPSAHSSERSPRSPRQSKYTEVYPRSRNTSITDSPSKHYTSPSQQDSYHSHVSSDSHHSSDETVDEFPSASKYEKTDPSSIDSDLKRLKYMTSTR